MRGGHGRDPRIRLAIVGFGRRGAQWAAAASRHSRFQLIGAVDPGPEAIDRAVGHGLQCWPNVEAAVRAGADAVVVASPSLLHAEHALLATAAGSGVLVEKPLALSVSDAARVAAGARAAQRPVLVAMNFRLRPVERAIRAGLGRVGPPRTSLIHATWMPAPADDRLDPHAAIWDVGVHHVDLLVDRAGTMPSTVSARAGAVHRIQLDWPSG